MAQRYASLPFHVIGMILAFWMGSIAVMRAYPPCFGRPFAPFAFAVGFLLLICAIGSIPRKVPEEVIPIVKGGIKLGMIIKLFFVCASLISGWYMYSQWVNQGPPPPPEVLVKVARLPPEIAAKIVATWSELVPPVPEVMKRAPPAGYPPAGFAASQGMWTAVSLAIILSLIGDAISLRLAGRG